ncbi:hypothetical protein AQUCO_00600028v1 [Aquilegia coerulea]|uniref:Nucleolar protein 56 n=1 Tax=Aquilegia coerulea TaxID=218851 RepID=A0A2G5EMQ9_AQUCA|nr:hypothetical protein AQUCO_00600028v1 [Aquilegia coerulea]
MREEREHGVFYNCEEKYKPWHLCESQQLLMVVAAEGVPIETICDREVADEVLEEEVKSHIELTSYYKRWSLTVGKACAELITGRTTTPILTLPDSLRNNVLLVTDEFRNFLELNLKNIQEGKKPKSISGVAESKFGSHISEKTKIHCQSNEFVLELLRGMRLHFERFIQELKSSDLEKAQLSLGHSYSRAKVKFNVNRVDNMVIQAIFLLDTLDKDINSFSMTVKEWFSWLFSELVKIVSDNYIYAKVLKFRRTKLKVSKDKITVLTDVLGDEAKAKEIVEAAKSSIGQNLSEIDLLIVQQFAQRVIDLAEYRKNLHEYLVDKMNVVAPNLTSLIGGARLNSYKNRIVADYILSMIILIKMREIDAASLGFVLIKNAVATVHGYCTECLWQANKDVGAIASLIALRIIYELSAAVIAYMLDKKANGVGEKNVFILNLSGGTFDTSLLTVKYNIFAVMSIANDTQMTSKVGYGYVIHYKKGKDNCHVISILQPKWIQEVVANYDIDLVVQPLTVIEQAGQHMSLNFSEGRPKSDGKEVILVVVDVFIISNHFKSLAPFNCSGGHQTIL